MSACAFVMEQVGGQMTKCVCVLAMKGQLRVTVIQLHSPFLTIDLLDSSDTPLFLY